MIKIDINWIITINYGTTKIMLLYLRSITAAGEYQLM